VCEHINNVEHRLTTFENRDAEKMDEMEITLGMSASMHCFDL
jgi:hypothetical protein